MLAPGSRLGSYELLAPLGKGGMGEVFRAKDLKLGREVAIKVLPDIFAADPDRLARFQREAQVLASLNHPNIATIHGFEDATEVHALVLELVDGPTLADRIAAGALPFDEALPIARQIAEALEAAHEQGIIHRDLKPANVKLRPDGTVKVLDFGLAKMLESEARPTSSLSMSPTLTSPAMTQLGVILGTASYMAPEQARGKPADRRSDIWAFGCVLFEMLAGVRAFDGEDTTETIAAVVRGEPRWAALPADLPAPILLLLRRCLEKDPRRRLGAVSAVLFVLNEPALVVPAVTTAARSGVAPLRRWAYVIAALAVTVAVIGLTAAASWLLLRPAPGRVSRLTIITPPAAPLARNVTNVHVAITPDGSRVVYLGATPGGVPALYSRSLDALEPVLLAPNASVPFSRPNSQRIGFFSQNSIRWTTVTGGPSVEVTKVEGAARGATWGPDDTIVYASASTETGLFRVAAAGGQPQVLTRPDAARGEIDHVLPRFLPGGHAVLFTITRATSSTDPSVTQVAVLDLRTPSAKPRVVIQGGSDARYVPTGHLVYLAGDSLRAVPFDLASLQVPDATPVPLLSGVATVGGLIAGDFDIAADGTLVYVPATTAAGAGRTLVWVDPRGGETPLAVPPKPYLYPRLSSNDSRIALDIREQDSDIWVWDLTRSGFTKVTKDVNLDRVPVWSHDDAYIIYSAMVDGYPNVYRQRADGAGTPERLASSPQGRGRFPLSLTPDGGQLLISDASGGIINADVTIVRLPGAASAGPQPPPEPRPLLQTPAGEANATVSPDGRWLAYQSNESGDWDVYVAAFDGEKVGSRFTVSNAGGFQPHWSRDGHELFYVSRQNEMMRVRVTEGGAWSASAPEKLFDAASYYFGGGLNPYVMYDVAKDGRFLLIKPVGGSNASAAAEDHLVVVVNWFEHLKQAVQKN
jgi:serine/threonine-protein kinase